MAKLAGLIKRAGLKEKNTPLSVRVPTSLLEDFSDHCARLQISVSDGVRLLIENELKEDLPVAPAAGGLISVNLDPVGGPVMPNLKCNPELLGQSTSAAATAAAAPIRSVAAAVNAIKPDGHNLPRGALAPFTYYEGNKKYLPCPVCYKWTLYSNMKARHLHDFENALQLFAAYPSETENLLKQKGLAL